MKLSRNGEINLLFTDEHVGKSCTSHESLTLQICILTLLAKIKFSRKFLNVEYLTRIFSYLVAEIDQTFLPCLGCLLFAAKQREGNQKMLTGSRNFLYVGLPFVRSKLQRICSRRLAD